MDQFEGIRKWLLQHTKSVVDKSKTKMNAGYRVLFWGPSGTGKRLAVEMLGKEFHKDIYGIDLSQVVRKYIGETEKHLDLVFRRAESKGSILFIEAPDALFGKKTDVKDAHDRYANLEVSYLLDRMEEYNGLVILATNLKGNLDDAFVRRFHEVLHFKGESTGE